MKISRFIIALGAVMLSVAGSANAQTAYPEKPVTVILPFSSGGAAEFAARTIADGLTSKIGQSFVVENRPGANGIVGTQLAINAQPDGYTLVLGLGATLSLNPSLYLAATYDPTSDFTPIGLFAKQPYLIAASPSLGVSTLPELIELAKERGGRLTFATGSTSHQLAGELLQKIAGATFTHIPYTATNQAIPDVISGRVDLIILAAFTAQPFVDQIVPLAVTSGQRAKLLPDVPTAVEAGYEGFIVDGWFGLLGPAGVDESVVSKLNEALVEHIESEETQEALSRAGFEPVTSSPEEFREFIASELDIWAELIKEAGIEAK